MTAFEAARDAFHAHLDTCARCANQPFNLCEVGARLLKEASVPQECLACWAKRETGRNDRFIHTCERAPKR